jgi:predicted amidohydrolase YtcJ
MGSDWAVSSANPLLAMEVAVTRIDPELRGARPPFLPDERIGLRDALAGYTSGSAWIDHLEAVLGSIELGKSADFVVLDRDLFDREAGHIGEARVIATFIDGVAVHEAPDAGMDG